MVGTGSISEEHTAVSREILSLLLVHYGQLAEEKKNTLVLYHA
jgi:hypothetical protein